MKLCSLSSSLLLLPLLLLSAQGKKKHEKEGRTECKCKLKNRPDKAEKALTARLVDSLMIVKAVVSSVYSILSML
jgi:hypothetical protein